MLIARLIQPAQRVFIGVINPMDLHVESAEEVRDRVLLAAKFLPLDQLGTTDDCGYAPYDNCEFISREKAYMKIRARVEGTKMVEEILNRPRHPHTSSFSTLFCLSYLEINYFPAPSKEKISRSTLLQRVEQYTETVENDDEQILGGKSNANPRQIKGPSM